MNSIDTCERIDRFMESHVSGWISETDVREFIESEVSLKDIFEALAHCQDAETSESIVRFLENAVRHKFFASLLLTGEYSSYVMSAANSPSDRLRALLAECIERGSGSAWKDAVDVNLDLLMTLLRDGETGIAERAASVVRGVISRLSADSKGKLFTELLHYYQAGMSSMTEIEQFRFLWLFLDIGKAEESLMNETVNGLLNAPIESYLSSDDILLKLSSLSFIEGLSRFPSGRQLLCKANILPTLLSELQNPMNEDDSTTIISLMFTIAGVLISLDASSSTKLVVFHPQSQFTKMLTKFSTAASNTERMCAFKIIGLLAESADKSSSVKSYLQSQWRLVSEIQRAITDVDVEVVNAAIDAVHSMVKHWESNPFMDSFACQLALIQQVLLSFKRHPFPECKCLIYSLLARMVVAEELADSAVNVLLGEESPVRRALTDFKSESNYDSRRAKWNFVKALTESVDPAVLSKHFSKENIFNLNLLAQNSPEWTPSESKGSEIATESI